MDRLVIHRSAMHPVTDSVLLDSDAKPMGEGSFYIKGETDLFEKAILFRPLAIAQRYFEYDAKESKYVGQTTYIISSWDNENKKFVENIAYDTRGTIRLGRPTGRELKELDPILQKEWRQRIKWQACIFGIAYFTGGNMDGRLVEYTASGTTGLDLIEFFKDVKKPLSQHLYNLTLERVNDVIKPRFRKYKTDSTASEVIKTKVKEVYNHINTVNESIYNKYTEINAVKADVQERLSGNDKLPTKKKNDEIPF